MDLPTARRLALGVAVGLAVLGGASPGDAQEWAIYLQARSEPVRASFYTEEPPWVFFRDDDSQYVFAVGCDRVERVERDGREIAHPLCPVERLPTMMPRVYQAIMDLEDKRLKDARRTVWLRDTRVQSGDRHACRRAGRRAGRAGRGDRALSVTRGHRVPGGPGPGCAERDSPVERPHLGAPQGAQHVQGRAARPRATLFLLHQVGETEPVREVKVHLGDRSYAVQIGPGLLDGRRAGMRPAASRSPGGRRHAAGRRIARGEGDGQPARRRLRADGTVGAGGRGEQEPPRGRASLGRFPRPRPRPVLSRRRRRRRRRGRPRGVRRGGVHARPAGGPGADDAARPGRRVRRREGGGQPSRAARISSAPFISPGWS